MGMLEVMPQHRTQGHMDYALEAYLYKCFVAKVRVARLTHIYLIIVEDNQASPSASKKLEYGYTDQK